MLSIRSDRALALVTSAALLASLTVATVAAPTSAAKPKCFGKTATIVGTNKGEKIVGTNKRDVIVAKGGNDKIFGRGGNDLICGGNGIDRIVGGPGIDKLLGNNGPDKLFGGPGPDRLFAGVGNDLVSGGLGPDVIDGGPGTDTCYQNAGTGPVVRCELPVVPVAPPPDPMSLTDVLAIAYSDVDGIDGPTTGDVLIAKLVDTHPGGTVSIGDTIEVDRYPTDTGANTFGDWTVRSHSVTGIDSANTQNIVVKTSTGGTHFWSDFTNSDVYGETPALARFQDGKGASSLEQISVTLGSPSAPTTAAAISDPGNDTDDAYLDVELNHIVP